MGKTSAGRGVAMSAQASVKYWMNINQTGSQHRVYHFLNTDRLDGSTITLSIYKSEKQNTEVVLYAVKNGGHTERSRQAKYGRLYKFIVGKPNHDIEMAEEVWAFFQNKQR